MRYLALIVVFYILLCQVYLWLFSTSDISKEYFGDKNVLIKLLYEEDFDFSEGNIKIFSVDTLLMRKSINGELINKKLFEWNNPIESKKSVQGDKYLFDTLFHSKNISTVFLDHEYYWYENKKSGKHAKYIMYSPIEKKIYFLSFWVS